MKYRIKEFSRERWHVLDETGHPIYDGADFGNDKPVIFTDIDAAMECAERLNESLQKQEQERNTR